VTFFCDFFFKQEVKLVYIAAILARVLVLPAVPLSYRIRQVVTYSEESIKIREEKVRSRFHLKLILLYLPVPHYHLRDSISDIYSSSRISDIPPNWNLFFHLVPLGLDY